MYNYVLSILTLNCSELFLVTKCFILFRSVLKQSDDLNMLSTWSSSGCVTLLYTMLRLRESPGTGPNSSVYLYVLACFLEPMYWIACHHLFLLESCRNWYQKSWSKTEMSCVLVPLTLKSWFDTRKTCVSFLQCIARRSWFCWTCVHKSERRPFQVQPLLFPARHSYTLQQHRTYFGRKRLIFFKTLPFVGITFCFVRGWK